MNLNKNISNVMLTENIYCNKTEQKRIIVIIKYKQINACYNNIDVLK